MKNRAGKEIFSFMVIKISGFYSIHLSQFGHCWGAAILCDRNVFTFLRNKYLL